VSALLAGPAQAQPKDYWTSIYIGGHGGWAGSTIEFPLNPGPGGTPLAGFATYPHSSAAIVCDLTTDTEVADGTRQG